MAATGLDVITIVPEGIMHGTHNSIIITNHEMIRCLREFRLIEDNSRISTPQKTFASVGTQTITTQTLLGSCDKCTNGPNRKKPAENESSLVIFNSREVVKSIYNGIKRIEHIISPYTAPDPRLRASSFRNGSCHQGTSNNNTTLYSRQYLERSSIYKRYLQRQRLAPVDRKLFSRKNFYSRCMQKRTGRFDTEDRKYGARRSFDLQRSGRVKKTNIYPKSPIVQSPLDINQNIVSDERCSIKF